MFIAPSPDAPPPPQLLPETECGSDSLSTLPGPGVPGIGTAYTGGRSGEGEVRLLALDARRPIPPLELGVADDEKSGKGVVAVDPALCRDEVKAKGEGGGKCPEVGGYCRGDEALLANPL
ncbi:hypothetical protein GGI09_008954 [Coemansia sp. S100]|nr:hypothetical protein GGI09_008954 [Coemansia sp. S100]